VGRIFALADLHLSLSGAKPMDVFGPVWTDHTRRLATAWDRVVSPSDTVLLGGDLSWARTLGEASADLEWIGERPGRKVLLRGNHDGWWTSLAAVRRMMPPGCEPLQNASVLVERAVVVGARGWTDPDDPMATESDRSVFRREIERLRLSIEHADRNYDRALPRVALLHFPPWIDGREPSAVVPLLEAARVAIVVYGHLHGADHALAVRGQHRGMRFCFVAADAVEFTPVELDLAELVP
jgi:predicted phosphohydrolase